VKQVFVRHVKKGPRAARVKTVMFVAPVSHVKEVLARDVLGNPTVSVMAITPAIQAASVS
tara:strand:+ start:12861 stop:13040 length:180 start_codon:yes stop_codon:yes gene_type:complete